MRRRFVRGVIALMLLVGSGCATLGPDYETPAVNVSSIRALPSESIVPRFEIGLHIVNPNRSALALQGIAYTLKLEGHKLLTGVANDLPTIEGYGEGEVTFRRLMTDPLFWNQKTDSASAAQLFKSSPSPYLSGLLEPGIENMVLLETQRGCPFRCGYCYYGKARGHMAFKDEAHLLETVRWTADRRIAELYLLDPTINARPGLMTVLDMIRKEFNVDENRIYLMGHSMGGAGTYYLGSKYAKQWAALAPIAPAAMGMTNDRVKVLQGIKDASVPMLVSMGDADEAVPVANVRMWVDTMKELALNYEYKEYPGVTHGPIMAASMADIYAFFARHTKPASR